MLIKYTSRAVSFFFEGPLLGAWCLVLGAWNLKRILDAAKELTCAAFEFESELKSKNHHHNCNALFKSQAQYFGSVAWLGSGVSWPLNCRPAPALCPVLHAAHPTTHGAI
jgi:hypothetical protein